VEEWEPLTTRVSSELIFKKTREIFKKGQNYVFIELHPKSGKKVEEKGC
jgi:hypothetical protein